MATILVVDDSTDNLDLLEYLLSRAGHEVTTALGGPAGLEQAGAVIPDLILIDLHMPVIDGWDLARRIRADERLAKVRLLAVSVGPASNARAREAGFDGFFPMPFEPSHLFSAVEALLNADGDR